MLTFLLVNGIHLNCTNEDVVVAGLGVGVIPYLPGDAVKIIFTALIGPKLRREIYRLGE